MFSRINYTLQEKKAYMKTLANSSTDREIIQSKLSVSGSFHRNYLSKPSNQILRQRLDICGLKNKSKKKKQRTVDRSR